MNTSLPKTLERQLVASNQVCAEVGRVSCRAVTHGRGLLVCPEAWFSDDRLTGLQSALTKAPQVMGPRTTEEYGDEVKPRLSVRQLCPTLPPREARQSSCAEVRQR